MADDCCNSGDGCCAPPPLQFPKPEAIKAVVPTSCEADVACGCHGGVPRFDGLDPRYKRVLWAVIGINGAMFLTEMIVGQLAGSQALKADALDFLADTVTYGLSLAVIGTSLSTRATAALFKGLSLFLMTLWVFGSTIYHTIILGLPSAELMGGIAVLALTANLASVVMLMRYKDGDANVRSVWLCSRNDAIGNVVVMIAAAGVWGTGTAWPDLGVAALMAGIFVTSSVQILRQAWAEYRDGSLHATPRGGVSLMAHSHDHHRGHDHVHAGHDHDHGEHDHHDHGGLGHVHAPASFGKAFAVSLGLNAAFVVLEVVFGIASNSVALLADAGHNLSDALGLGVAWAAVILAKRKPTVRFTYGLGGTSILAALFNAVFLLVVVGGLSWEAIQRFSEPEPVAGKTVMIVAACGIFLNGFCTWLFASGSKGDLNARGAFMHMAADALVSLGVVVAGFIILLTGWHWIDPAMSLIINAVIIWGTWSLLKGSISMSLNAVPAGIDTAKVEAYLKGLPGVLEVHDLHIWSMSTTETALTAHLVHPSGLDDELLVNAAHELEQHFKIQHATIQMETGAHECKLAPAHVV